MSEHAPLPWRKKLIDVVGGGHALYIEAGGRTICTVLTDRPTPQQHADFDLIVRAVNNFDALLEALKHAQARLFVHEGNSDVYEKCRWVIIEAEGR